LTKYSDVGIANFKVMQHYRLYRKNMKWYDRITIGFIFLLLIIPLVPTTTVSGDNGISWSEANSLIISTLDYIMKNHPDAPATIRDGSSWSLVTAPAMDCSSGYKYKSRGWSVTICYTDTAAGLYNITAVYEGSGIIWTGVATKGKVTEISYRNPALK
jgi:hypothetical protein